MNSNLFGKLSAGAAGVAALVAISVVSTPVQAATFNPPYEIQVQFETSIDNFETSIDNKSLPVRGVFNFLGGNISNWHLKLPDNLANELYGTRNTNPLSQLTTTGDLIIDVTVDVVKSLSQTGTETSLVSSNNLRFIFAAFSGFDATPIWKLPGYSSTSNFTISADTVSAIPRWQNSGSFTTGYVSYFDLIDRLRNPATNAVKIVYSGQGSVQKPSTGGNWAKIDDLDYYAYAVPEPSTYVGTILAFGALGAAKILKRQQKKQETFIP